MSDQKTLWDTSSATSLQGGGFWSLALRYAGWLDTDPAWTGSCPCPSFSAAGKGRGFDDPRHLWPEWFRLIGECQPPVLFGEQVGAAIAHGWLDLVSTDLEAEGYAVAAAVFGACSVGAPHRRQRLYFCADTEDSDRRRGERGESGSFDGSHPTQRGDGSESGVLEFAQGNGREGGEPVHRGDDGQIADDGRRTSIGVDLDAPSPRLEGHFGDVRDWRGPGWLDPQQARSVAEAGATRGFWADCDWWHGRDGKYRPIEPGIFPLAHGYPNRVGILRLAGDAINIEQAKIWIEAYREARGLTK